jgi:hypothetical protein
MAPNQDPEHESDDLEAKDEGSEQSRFIGFVKKLVSVPKKEIDEKAEDWKQERGRKR